jgi:hypothetical protein
MSVLLLIATAIYVGLNMYLWSLHQSQGWLFIETVPLGIAYCLGFYWYLIRS